MRERGEGTSRHGRATFSVLLFQDLAVVVLLILIPLISPSSSKGGIGFQAIVEALGLAAVKALVAISAIIAGGRLLLRPIYKHIAENQNAEIFSANKLLVILGTSLLTARAFSWHWEHFWLVCFLQKLNFPYGLNQILLHIVTFYWVSSS